MPYRGYTGYHGSAQYLVFILVLLVVLWGSTPVPHEGLWVNILVGVTGKGWSQLRLNRWSWNLLGTFYRVKLDCVPKEFVRRRFVLAIFAIRSEMAYSRFSAINFISPQRSNAEQNPLVRTYIIPQTILLLSYSFNRLNCTSKSSIQSPWHLQQYFSEGLYRLFGVLVNGLWVVVYKIYGVLGWSFWLQNWVSLTFLTIVSFIHVWIYLGMYAPCTGHHQK